MHNSMAAHATVMHSAEVAMLTVVVAGLGRCLGADCTFIQGADCTFIHLSNKERHCLSICGHGTLKKGTKTELVVESGCG